MKKLLFVLLVVLGLNPLIAQDTGPDTYTIQRLLIYNDDGNVLLEKHPNGWMTPALRHNKKVTVNQGLEQLASEYGLRITKPKLAGIFMFISEYKPQSSFRQHFVSELVSGELIVPEGKLEVIWVSPERAITLMSDPNAKLVGAVREMTEQIIHYPGIIWGGTFTLWKEDGVTQYRTSEHFYPIAERD